MVLWYNLFVRLTAGEDFLMIKISTEYITLGQLLKMTDWISSGGEAKFAVKELKIFVNQQKEDRRGRKLYPGDEIQIKDQNYVIGK